MKIVMIATLFLLSLLSSGCVMKGTHEATLAELGKTQDSLVTAQSKISKQSEELSAQELQIRDNNKKIAQTNSELAKLESNKVDLERNRLELEGELERSLELINSSQAQILTLSQIEAETQKRNQIYAKFVKELQKMIDGGELTLNIEKGRIVINLPENVLFATARADINKQGQEALRKIANVLKEFNDRRFQVEGHTDDIPMKSTRYASNWELSTARALSVVHLMIQEGVAAKNVSASGFGEFQPRADNETKEGRALNRRIEIIMLPNLEILSSELPKVVN